MATKKYENEVQFTLRINKDVYNAVKEIASKDGRSTTKQIEFILKKYVECLKNQE